MYNEAKVPVYIMTIWKGAGKVNKKLANRNIFQLHILRQTSPFQMTEGRGTEGVGVGVGADLFFKKKMEFIPCKAEPPLQCMDLQEKEVQKD